jgi:hypothetical protein
MIIIIDEFIYLYNTIKTTRILFFSLAFLLFSCGAKHDVKQLSGTETPHSVKQNKTHSVPGKISALEKWPRVWPFPEKAI